ncbi:MAG TPA: DUF1080 domain-containing protein [Anaerolineae bacterium]|nr:DUF1080 domain-containing protein [Anaerolineae bacterium]HQH38500.1 DUF1080 domain-containing protein [Anaerolineae bacterium]
MKTKRALGRWLANLALCLMLVGTVACASRRSATWSEPFDAPGDWHLSSDAAANVAVEDGVLRVHVIEVGQVAWASAGRTYDDFRLTVEATQVSGPADNEYGVLVRMQDDQHFYAFSVSGDGYVRAARYDGTSWIILGPDWSASAAVNQGAAMNVLEVEVTGGTFIFRVNDTQVLQVEDATYTRGDIGLYAGSFSEGDVVITFDNLEVQPLF